MDPKARIAEITAGYQHSIVLLTANHLGIFAAMGKDAKPAADIAKSLGLDPRATEVVLLALAAEGILVQAIPQPSEAGPQPSRFRIAEPYAPLLLPDSPQTQSNILKHNFNIMHRWVRLADTLRTGKPVALPMAEPDAESLRSFICGMADISRASSAEVAQKVDLSPYKKMLDLGGGPGTSSIVFARRYPQLSCVVFDLPGPLEIAREQIAEAHLEDRITICPGDYFRDDFGAGFDLIYISNIIHSIGPADTAMLFEKSYRALENGGAIIVKDFFLDDSRTSPAHGAFFSINMLVGTEAGKSYTLNETRNLLQEAGFHDFRAVEVASASKLLIGTK